MRYAFCPTCNTYPTELLSLPFLGIDEETSEPIRGEDAVLLTNGGGATNRYEDGTAGVTQEEREAAEEDDSPSCATCHDSDLEWRDIEGELHPIRKTTDPSGLITGVTMRYCSIACRDQCPLEGIDGMEPTGDIPEGWCCDLCGKQLRPEKSFLERFNQEFKEPSEAFGEAVDELNRTPFRGIPYLVEKMTMDERRQFAEHFMGLATNMTRLGIYLEWRCGGGNGDQGHEKAVKEQNRVAVKVRRAMGYQNTPDLNF